MRKASLFVIGSTLALLSSPAVAQSAARPDGGSVGGGTAAAGTEIGEIVVTATRTESLASKTPIALSAISGDNLRSSGVVSPTLLGNQVPNLSIDRANGLQITIRGVTSTDGTEKGDPSAAFLLDGVYIARPQAADVSFFDVERVEVLRGPQGTLYGRNTTAGVVNVISNKPQLGKVSAGANAGYGSYNSYNADGFINVPAGEKVAFRAAASYDQRDNYITPIAGDTTSIDPFRKNFAGRLQAYIKASDTLNILLRADYAKLEGSRTATVRSSNFFDMTRFDSSGNPIYIGDGRSASQLLTRGSVMLPNPGGKFGVGDTSTSGPGVDDHAYSFEGELNWNIGPATATYLGSYRRYFAHENGFADVGAPSAFPTAFDGAYRQTSHELRVATNGDGPLKLQAGAYYFREESSIGLYLLNFPFVPTPVYGFPQDPTISRSIAGYGQGIYSLTNHLRLTLGGRYTDDYKFRYGHTVFQQTLAYNPATDQRLQNAANIDGNIVHTKFTWRAGLDADVGERGLAYATVSTGYKAGGFGDGCLAGTTTFGEVCNQARNPSVLFYQPETLTAYEVGFKNRFAGDMIRFSGAIFHYDYKNLQLSQIANVNGGPSTVTLNAGSAKVTGVELEATIRLDRHNNIDLSYNYLDAHYAAYCPQGLAAGSTSVCSGPDYAGRELDRSPKNVFAAGYTLTLPLANGATIAASVHTRLSSHYVLTNFGSALQYRNPSYSKTDLSLTYTALNGRYYIQAYGQNLENHITINSVDGFNNIAPGDPRTYGVRVGMKY